MWVCRTGGIDGEKMWSPWRTALLPKPFQRAKLLETIRLLLNAGGQRLPPRIVESLDDWKTRGGQKEARLGADLVGGLAVSFATK